MPLSAPRRWPRPSWSDLSARSELSTAQLRVLEVVEQSPEPLTAAQIGTELELHHNTVREHLEVLGDAGFVTTTTEHNGRRGRPALRYASTTPDPGLVLDTYLSLLDAVAESLGTGGAATEQARAIGRQWARNAAEGAPPLSADERSEGLAALLPELVATGFAPETTDRGVVLRACPLVTGCRVPDLRVCAMHEGYLNELLDRAERNGGAETDGGQTDTGQTDGTTRTGSTDQGERGGAPAHDPGGRTRLTIAPLLPDGCHLSLER